MHAFSVVTSSITHISQEGVNFSLLLNEDETDASPSPCA